MTLATLDALWRATDRELIRGYAGIPASHVGLSMLTDHMNGLAGVSPPTVTKVQAWIDEIESLEADLADLVADRRAHLGDAKVYEGIRPGAPPSRDDILKKAGPLEYDTESLFKVRYESGGNPGATASGQTNARTSDLKARIMLALSLETSAAPSGTFMLERS
jgi:hypothetical protein